MASLSIPCCPPPPDPRPTPTRTRSAPQQLQQLPPAGLGLEHLDLHSQGLGQAQAAARGQELLQGGHVRPWLAAQAQRLQLGQRKVLGTANRAEGHVHVWVGHDS